MRVRMKTTSADPVSVRLAGKEYEMEDGEARMLIRYGYALPLGSLPIKGVESRESKNARSATRRTSKS